MWAWMGSHGRESFASTSRCEPRSQPRVISLLASSGPMSYTLTNHKTSVSVVEA